MIFAILAAVTVPALLLIARETRRHALRDKISRVIGGPIC